MRVLVIIFLLINIPIVSANALDKWDELVVPGVISARIWNDFPSQQYFMNFPMRLAVRGDSTVAIQFLKGVGTKSWDTKRHYPMEYTPDIKNVLKDNLYLFGSTSSNMILGSWKTNGCHNYIRLSFENKEHDNNQYYRLDVYLCRYPCYDNYCDVEKVHLTRDEAVEVITMLEHVQSTFIELAANRGKTVTYVYPKHDETVHLSNGDYNGRLDQGRTERILFAKSFDKGMIRKGYSIKSRAEGSLCNILFIEWVHIDRKTADSIISRDTKDQLRSLGYKNVIFDNGSGVNYEYMLQ